MSSILEADSGRGYEHLILGSALAYGRPVLDEMFEVAIEVPVFRGKTGNLNHKAIWSAIYDLYDAGAPVNEVTVYEALAKAGKTGTDGAITLMDISKHGVDPADVPYHVRGWIAYRVKDEARMALAQLGAIAENGTTAEEIEAGLARIQVGLHRYAAPDPDEHDGEPVLVWMSDVREVDVEWFWEPYIPIGFLTGLEGDPGQGKSFVSHALATGNSLGVGLPGKEPTEPGNSLLLTAEDDLGATVTKRLGAMGADRKRIAAVSEPWAITDAEGRAKLERLILASEASLVVVDPFINYLGPDMNPNNANEMRAALRPLASLARKHRCAIVVIRHLSKGQAQKAMYRGQGSIDFAAACRSVMIAGCPSKDSDERAVVQIKNNLAPTGKPMGYSLETGLFRWTGESDATAGDILDGESEGGTALREAKEFLKETLANGPVEVEQIQKEAQKQGISKAALYRAKTALKVRSARQSREDGYRGEGQWEWYLSP